MRAGRVLITTLAVAGALPLATGMAHGQSADQRALQRQIDELRRALDQQQQTIRTLEGRLQALQAEQADAARMTAETARKTEEARALVVDRPLVAATSPKVKLAISGQVNRAVLFADNGDKHDVFHVDNDASSTRVRFTGEGAVTPDLTIGSQIEIEFQSNASNVVAFGQDNAGGFSPGDGDTLNERKYEFYIDSKDLGRLWIGQGDPASNGTSEIDLSGTEGTAYSSLQDMGGGLAFADGGDGAPPTIGQVFNNFDGRTRDDRVRYDTPKVLGLQASASLIENDIWDVALRYGQEFAGTKVAAALAYSDQDARFDFEQINGSASVLLPFGLNLTGAAGIRLLSGPRDGEDDPIFLYGKLGYLMSPLAVGKTALAVDVGYNEDVAREGDEAFMYGAYAVQNIDAAATELYVGVRNFELERRNVGDLDNILTVWSGARVKF